MPQMPTNWTYQELLYFNSSIRKVSWVSSIIELFTSSKLPKCLICRKNHPPNSPHCKTSQNSVLNETTNTYRNSRRTQSLLSQSYIPLTSPISTSTLTPTAQSNTPTNISYAKVAASSPSSKNFSREHMVNTNITPSLDNITTIITSIINQVISAIIPII